MACVSLAAVECQQDTVLYQCANNLIELSFLVKDIHLRQDFKNLKAQATIVDLAKSTLKLCEPAIKSIDFSKIVQAMAQQKRLGRSSPEADPSKVNSYSCQSTMLDSYNALNSCKGLIFAFPLDFKKVIIELIRSGLDYSPLSAACA